MTMADGQLFYKKQVLSHGAQVHLLPINIPISN